MDTVAITENMMEHIAWVLRKDPEQVRLANLRESEKDVLVGIMMDLKNSADYEARREAVVAFNEVRFFFQIMFKK